MRYPASEKLEIIRLVEQSHLPVRRTSDKLGILSFPEIPSGTDSRREAESIHHSDRCL
jgi:hypothetical protein